MLANASDLGCECEWTKRLPSTRARDFSFSDVAHLA
jgi:hypothetical protein